MEQGSFIVHTRPRYQEGATRPETAPDEMSRRRQYGQLVAGQLALLQSGAALSNEPPEQSALRRRIRGWSNPDVRANRG